jgi:hypothetical protein
MNSWCIFNGKIIRNRRVVPYCNSFMAGDIFNINVLRNRTTFRGGASFSLAKSTKIGHTGNFLVAIPVELGHFQ